MVFRSTRDIMRFSCITCISLPVGFVVLVTCMVDCPHPKALLETAGLGAMIYSVLGHSAQNADLKLIVALYYGGITEFSKPFL